MRDFIEWLKEGYGYAVDGYMATFGLILTGVVMLTVLTPLVPFIKLYRWVKR